MGRETPDLGAHFSAPGCTIPCRMSSKSHALQVTVDGVRDSAIRGDPAVGRCDGGHREAAHDWDRCVGGGGITVEREDAVCGGVAQHRLSLEEQVHAAGQPVV